MHYIVLQLYFFLNLLMLSSIDFISMGYSLSLLFSWLIVLQLESRDNDLLSFHYFIIITLWNWNYVFKKLEFHIYTKSKLLNSNQKENQKLSHIYIKSKKNSVSDSVENNIFPYPINSELRFKNKKFKTSNIYV